MYSHLKINDCILVASIWSHGSHAYKKGYYKKKKVSSSYSEEDERIPTTCFVNYTNKPCFQINIFVRIVRTLLYHFHLFQFTYSAMVQFTY